jgi:hypothetical protein
MKSSVAFGLIDYIRRKLAEKLSIKIVEELPELSTDDR